MKHALLIGTLSSIAALSAPAALATPKPSTPAAEAQRPTPKPSFWLAADPHVPLAVVDGHRMHAVGKRGKDCGAAHRWAKPKSRWHAVDAWGRITGSFEVKGSELLDVTQCREVSFTKRSGDVGAGLFVSEDSGYKPRDAMSYTPSVVEKKRLERLLLAMEEGFVNHRPLGKLVPWARRTMFFQFPPPKDPSWEGRVDGNGKPIERPKRWAVVGGPILVVAYLGRGGSWHASSVKAPLGLMDSYLPVAVFDMNADGVPEIVYQQNDGPNFADAVMSFNSATMTWENAVESPGGAAL